MAAHSIDQVRATAIMAEYRRVMPFDTELPDGWAALLDQLNGQGDRVHPALSSSLNVALP